MRYTIAPPGLVPLRSTLFSLADVPDLRALAELWPDARDIWMGAGPVPEIFHRALICLAWLVRLRVVPTLTPLARFMSFTSNRFSWGEHRGGMFIEVGGVAADGAVLKRSWHLLAEGDDGPLIPSMAVAAIIAKFLDGATPVAGARAATRDVELDDYEALFTGRTIKFGTRERIENSAPLYERVLGTAWRRLPGAIRSMHSVKTDLIAEGRADIDRGNGMLPRAIGWIMGFPKAGREIPVSVQFKAVGGVETWTRDFGGARFSSKQFEGKGRSQFLLHERFGPLCFAMALVAEEEGLRLVLRRWNCFGVPLPMRLCPRSDSYEIVADGRFRFHVEISLIWVGLVVRYRGWLVPRS
jgi:hypothetical protein